MKAGPLYGIFLACLLLISAWVFVQAELWDRAMVGFDRNMRIVDLSQAERKGGLHRYFLEPDSLYWLSFAREMAETGTWRIRHTGSDNAPEGRPVHWSQSMSWLIVLFAEVAKPFSPLRGDYLREAAAIWVNPVIFLVTVGIGGFVLLRRFGLFCAVVFAGLAATMPYAVLNYQAVRPDHQSLHVSFLLLEVVFLLAGGLGFQRAGGGLPRRWTLAGWSFPDAKQARLDFACAGVMAGCGFWIGATPQLVAHGLIFGGFVLLRLLSPKIFEGFKHLGEDVVFQPAVWRRWGLFAAGTSLFWYLVEYFPAHLHLRPEINQPLYALALFLLGLLIGEIASPAGRKAGQRRRTGVLMGALLLIVVVPFFFHSMRDPQMARWHNFITEFYSLPRFSSGGIFPVLFGNGFLYLLPLLFVILFGIKRVSGASLLFLSMTWILALGFFMLFYLQVRWYGFCALFLALFGAFFVVCLFSEFPKGRIVLLPWGLLLAMLGHMIAFSWLEQQKLSSCLRPTTAVEGFITPLVLKRLSFALKDALAGKEAVILADPDQVPYLQYYAGIPGVVSFYWENLPGLRLAVDVSNASTEEEAIATMRRRGITHVLAVQDSKLPAILFFVKHGRFDSGAAAETFFGKLFSGESRPAALTQPFELSVPMRQIYWFNGRPLSSQFEIWQVDPGRP